MGLPGRIRDGVFSALVIALVLTVALSMVVPGASLVAGALTLAAAAVGGTRLRRGPRLICLALTVLGVAALGAAQLRGRPIELASLLRLNQDLVAMLAAVGFTQLVTGSSSGGRVRLVGAPAVWRTAAATHLLGSVINISAVDLVGTHVAGTDRRLTLAEALVLSRAFSTGALWSPFWGASAAALAYASGARVGVLVAVGLLLALVAGSCGIFGLTRSHRSELQSYEGFALSWQLLRIPLALVALVLGCHALWPQLKVPNIVLLGSLALTVAVLLLRTPRTAAVSLYRHAIRSLPQSRSETTLFASAGVLAVGLGAYLSTTLFVLPLPAFTVAVAWVAAVAMTLLSLVGVHPVVSIATLATLIAPLHPDPTLLALAAMISWAASAAAGPVSGLNVYLSSRFRISSFRLARHNLAYALVLLALGWPALALCDMLLDRF